jgi:LacI family transcriptional regulator
MPTLEEIAKISGVSRSTVSRVINNDERVNETTRQRVLEIIRQSDFHPNTAARRLAGGRTRILGLVIPRGVSAIFTDPYFPILIQSVSSACNAHNYSMMLWLAEYDHESRMIQQILNNGLIDGVIMASAIVDDPVLTALSGHQMPLVLIGRHPFRTDINYVDVDNLNSARQAVAHLLRLGRRRIATIAGPATMTVGIDRLEGYKAALKKHGLIVDPDLIVESDFSEGGGYAAMKRLLNFNIDAVFAASDAMATGALRALREKELPVPGEISVVGFDDMPFAARSDPPLTTIRQPTQRVGAVAVESLLNIIEDPSIAPVRILLPTDLVIRESCWKA